MIAPDIRRILAPNPSPTTGPGTNTYLIGGTEVVVVDPGPAQPEHVEGALRVVGESGGRVVAILVTHGHPDHLPGAALFQVPTGAPILGHRLTSGVDRHLADAEALDLGRRRIVALETPGHAADHLCFWLPADCLLFSGDLIAGVGTVVLENAPGALARYLASLHRLAALGPLAILPGHGPVVPNGQAKIAEYLAHRAMREAQIVDALRQGPTTADELVRRLYVDTPPELLSLAARNVRAHLEHLAAAGRAVVTGNRWELGPAG